VVYFSQAFHPTPDIAAKVRPSKQTGILWSSSLSKFADIPKTTQCKLFLDLDLIKFFIGWKAIVAPNNQTSNLDLKNFSIIFKRPLKDFLATFSFLSGFCFLISPQLKTWLTRTWIQPDSFFH
jgi:hypothetical protein